MRGSAFTDRSIQVEDKTERPLGLNQRRPGPLNRGDRLIEAKIKVIKGEKLETLTTDRLLHAVSDLPLDKVPLNTGSNV